MKHLIKTLAVILSLALFTTVFTACGETAALEDYSTTVAATFGDEQIMMDEANFFLRYEQATMESYYWSMYQQYGYDNPWVAPAPGNDNSTNKTMADYLKELIMQQLHQTKTLVYFASNYDLSMDDIDVEECETTACEMYDELDEALLEAAPITEEQLTEWVKENALANLVAQAIKEQADTTYTEDEVNVYTVTYATFTDDTDYGVETTEAESETDEEGNVIETEAEETEAETDEDGNVVETEAETDEDGNIVETEAEEEPKSGEQKAEEFLAAVNEAGDLCTAADADDDVTESTSNYLIAGDKDAEEDDDILYKKTKNLAVGEVVSFYDKDSETYYVAERTEDCNEDAVETKTEAVIDEKKDEYFADVIEDLYSQAPSFTVTDAWKNLVVTTGEKLIPDTEEEDEETEEALSDDLVEDALDETIYVDGAEEASSVVESMNEED